jgi:probable addiction module antidote protein
MKHKASTSHDEAMVRELRENPDFAAEYLRAALQDAEEPRVLLVALRRVAEARGGVAKVAKAAGIERESLYRALSAHGNPRLSTLVAVTKAMGLKITVETVTGNRIYVPKTRSARRLIA